MTRRASSHGARGAPQPASPAAVRGALILALSAASGYVDAVSYLALGRVFTANMTGNTVLLGLALAQGDGLAAVRSFAALVGFAAGVALGHILIARAGQRGIWPARATLVCALEALTLVILGAAGLLSRLGSSNGIYLLIALAAIAMGMQTAAVRALNVQGVASTYITGTWATVIVGLVSRLGIARPALAQEQPAQARGRNTGLQAAVLCVYLGAAALGGAAALAWNLAAMLVPAGATVVVVIVATWRWHRPAATR